MMKKHFVPILLGLLLFACVAGLALESNRAQQAEAALEEIYQSALMETTEQMQALSLALEKVLVSGDAAQCTRLLSQISQLSDDVRRNLTFLPLSHEAMAPTLVLPTSWRNTRERCCRCWWNRARFPRRTPHSWKACSPIVPSWGRNWPWRSSPCRNSSWRYIPASGCSAP